MWCLGPTRAIATSVLRFLDHKQRRTTFGRTPLDEWEARCTDLYLTTHNTHKRETSMPPAGFEPTISAGERPKNHALDRAVTCSYMYACNFNCIFFLYIKCSKSVLITMCNFNIHSPCIANKFSEYNQHDATFINLFISVRRSACFRRGFLPSSGAQNCTFSVRYL